MLRAEWDPEAEHVQTSTASDQELASITWLERSTTVQVPVGHTVATWPSADKKLTYAIRSMITAAAQNH